MFIRLVTNDERFKILSSLNNSFAEDMYGLSNRILKLSAPVLSEFLTRAVNGSIQEGVFHRCLKLSKVIPIHKSGDMLDPTNYRPVSLLPTLSKVYEKALHQRLNSFL